MHPDWSIMFQVREKVNVKDLMHAFFQQKSTRSTRIHKPKQLSGALINAGSVCNKASNLHELITSKDIDLTFNTESWLSGERKDNTYLADLLPPTYDIVHKPRETGRGVEDRERLRTLLGEWIVRYRKCYYYY